MDSTRIVIAGGTGLVGRVLRTHFENQGREVVVLSREEGKGEGSYFLAPVSWKVEALA